MRRILILGVVSAIALFMTASAFAGGSKSSFKPGLYVGKTSQGYPVKLRLTVGGQACDGKPCLFAPDDKAEIYVEEPCKPEGSTNEYLALFGDLVTKSGTVHADQEGFSTTKATLEVGHDGTLTGKVRSYGTLENGTKCDSGNVTLSAKIGGSTK